MSGAGARWRVISPEQAGFLTATEGFPPLTPSAIFLLQAFVIIAFPGDIAAPDSGEGHHAAGHAADRGRRRPGSLGLRQTGAGLLSNLCERRGAHAPRGTRHGRRADLIGGAAIAARIFGERWSFGLALGSLLQAKGLTELVVLTVLLDAQILSPRIFAPVLMALAGTAVAMPLARLALAKTGERRPIAEPAP